MIVLRWQFSQGALVITCLAGLPIAPLPLWQRAQPLVAIGWLDLEGPLPVTLVFGPKDPKALPLPGPGVGSPLIVVPGSLDPGCGSKFGGPVGGFAAIPGFDKSAFPASGFGIPMVFVVPAIDGFGATIGFVGAVFAVSIGFGVASKFVGPAVGGFPAVKGFAGVVFAVSAGFGAFPAGGGFDGVMSVVGLVFAGPTGFGAPTEFAVPTVVGWFATATDCLGGVAKFVALRTTTVTAPNALVITDLIFATTVAGTGDVAVVVQVPAESLGLLQLDVLWQQPQSAVTLGWSLGFACAPIVPWLV